MSLKIENIAKSYGKKKVVDRVSFELNRGEVVGLLGPNGAGKTTIFYMIVGMIRSGGGKIFLDAKEITHLPMHKRARGGIGYLPQEASIFRGLKVEENVMAICQMLSISKRARHEKAQSLLRELGISQLAERRAETLSGGEKRRVEIARALVTSPSYILLDEPFVGIDPLTVVEIQNIVASLKKKGIGVLITDHNVRETLEITDRAYIIYEGRILFFGTARELTNSSEARRVYLGEKFRM